MHESKTDAVEYSPAPHSAHRLAPVLAPVLVIDPAWHVEHAAALETVEYSPAPHSVQLLAPELAAVLVMEPAKHGRQYEFPPLDWYFAASHAMHDASLVDGWYSPESHVAQSPSFTYFPGIQSLQ